MAMTHMTGTGNPKRGIALLVTLIFMSVMLAFGLALASLAYKQSVLSSTVTQSQVAFYAADGAFECLLYGDSQGEFIYGSAQSPAVLVGDIATKCNGMIAPGTTPTGIADGTLLRVKGRISFRDTSGNLARCADIEVDKYNPTGTQPTATGPKNFLYVTGYNTSCSGIATAGARIVVRGLNAVY